MFEMLSALQGGRLVFSSQIMRQITRNLGTPYQALGTGILPGLAIGPGLIVRLLGLHTTSII